MSRSSWCDYMTRIALKSNRECEARLPVLLLRTVLTADSLFDSALANLKRAACAAGVPAEALNVAQPWEGAELMDIVTRVRGAAVSKYDADVRSYELLIRDARVRSAGGTITVVKKIIKLFNQVELAVYFRSHDLDNPRSGTCARPPAHDVPSSAAYVRLAPRARLARRTGKARDIRTPGDSLDKAAIARVRTYLRKLGKMAAVVNAVIQVLPGVAHTDLRANSDETLAACVAGRVPWRPSDDSTAGASSGVQDEAALRLRARTVAPAQIRLYFAYHR